MADKYVLVRFTPALTVHPLSDPMIVYETFAAAETDAIAAQQASVTSQVAILEAVAVTGFSIPPVTITLLGATVPTTV